MKNIEFIIWQRIRWAYEERRIYKNILCSLVRVLVDDGFCSVFFPLLSWQHNSSWRNTRVQYHSHWIVVVIQHLKNYHYELFTAALKDLLDNCAHGSYRRRQCDCSSYSSRLCWSLGNNSCRSCIDLPSSDGKKHNGVKLKKRGVIPPFSHKIRES